MTGVSHAGYGAFVDTRLVQGLLHMSSTVLPSQVQQQGTFFTDQHGTFPRSAMGLSSHVIHGDSSIGHPWVFFTRSAMNVFQISVMGLLHMLSTGLPPEVTRGFLTRSTRDFLHKTFTGNPVHFSHEMSGEPRIGTQLVLLATFPGVDFLQPFPV